MGRTDDLIFPDLDAAEVSRRTAAMWDLTRSLPIPKPGWLACPVCRGETVQPRTWQFHERRAHPTIRWRCDVSFKCCDCAHVWTHGVALTDDAWERRAWQTRPRRVIQWREARRMLADDERGATS